MVEIASVEPSCLDRSPSGDNCEVGCRELPPGAPKAPNAVRLADRNTTSRSETSGRPFDIVCSSVAVRRLLKKYGGSRYRRHGAGSKAAPPAERSETADRREATYSHALRRAPTAEVAPCRHNP